MIGPADEPTGVGSMDEAESFRHTYVLTLFVTGRSVRSERAVANLRRICRRLGDRCELTIVDVLERPELAEREKVLATPTVVRNRPLPRRRIIGDLSDPERVVLELDLPLAADNAEVDATS
jgi:circadian clock protein KaiB